MATFQSVVLITAIVILIIFLIVIGISLYYQHNSAPWPPKTPLCPDYWVAIPNDVDPSTITNWHDVKFNYGDIGNGTFDASGAKCVNVKDLGTCPAPQGQHMVMDFSTGAYKGDSGLCQKYKWAHKCGVSWDGITYGTKYTPCDPSYLSGDSSAMHTKRPVGGQCYLSSSTFTNLGHSLVGN